MEGQDRDPVQSAAEPLREENGPLSVGRSARGIRFGAEFEPGPARQLHLGAEPEEPATLDALDPPEVEGVARVQRLGVTATAAKAHSPHELVQHSAGGPGDGQGVPAVVAADPLDHLPELLDRGIGMLLLEIDVHGVAGPVGIAREEVGGSTLDRRVLPARLDLADANALEGEAHRPAVRGEASLGLGDEAGDVVLVDDAVILQRGDDRDRERPRDRRDEVDPLRGEPGCEHGESGDGALLEPRLERVAVHHLAVAQHIGAADVEGAVDLGWQRRRLDEVVEYVAHGDRLDEVAHPLRRRHVGQHVGEMADHLERRGTGADHDAGLECHGRHTGGDEDPPDLGPGAQVRREFAIGVESAQVDDAGDARGLRRQRDVLRGVPLGLFEVAGSAHAVHEVVEHLDALDGGRQRGGLTQVAGHDLDLVGPGDIEHLGGVAHKDPHVVARLEQFRDESSPDVSGRASDENLHRPTIVSSPLSRACVPADHRISGNAGGAR